MDPIDHPGSLYALTAFLFPTSRSEDCTAVTFVQNSIDYNTGKRIKNE